MALRRNMYSYSPMEENAEAVDPFIPTNYNPYVSAPSAPFVPSTPAGPVAPSASPVIDIPTTSSRVSSPTTKEEYYNPLTLQANEISPPTPTDPDKNVRIPQNGCM